MSFNISEKIKALRKEKGISQEKLAQYMGVSFQAISKWENGNTSPDISLLPDLARFFGVTVDELLSVEKLDEEKLFEEYRQKAYELFRNNKRAEDLEVWLEAYKKMPNNIQVKEMLMSAYSDTDKIRYKNEIIELGTEIYNSDAGSYYKGQAIREIAKAYAENGNMELAEKWCYRSYQLMHSSDVLAIEISKGDELLRNVSFYTHWALRQLPYIAFRLHDDEEVSLSKKQKQDIYKTIANIYDVVYKNDDMSFESLRLMMFTHENIAELEVERDGDTEVVRKHLERAFDLAVKSSKVTEHSLDLPLLYGWDIDGSPSDNRQCLELFKNELAEKCFDAYREAVWFKAIMENVVKLI